MTAIFAGLKVASFLTELGFCQTIKLVKRPFQYDYLVQLFNSPQTDQHARYAKLFLKGYISLSVCTQFSLGNDKAAAAAAVMAEYLHLRT